MEVGKHVMKLPKMMKKMGAWQPNMFMMGMAQANLHNFVMQSLMMSKMALSSMVMMFIRDVVFGDKKNPVRYYNFGYEKPPPPAQIHPHELRKSDDGRRKAFPFQSAGSGGSTPQIPPPSYIYRRPEARHPPYYW